MDSQDNAREDIPRVSVGSIQDWKRIEKNYRDQAIQYLDTAIKSKGQQSEHDLIMAHFDEFIEATFLIAQENLRVNGHNFDEKHQSTNMEAFDEALDRRIWSLADTRLQWHKRTVKTRRELPIDTETRLRTLLNTNTISEANAWDGQNDATGNLEDFTEEDYEDAKESLNEITKTSAITEELDQNVPDQENRVERIKVAVDHVKNLKR